eukprot:TRINITY_DN1500_c0_g1_i6.p1 TRINITY_DN1500_c0_g1~~TRINITY_DN1500_c0_g1_i6.p1  ORF type:complete len:781 (-),score=204.86 TRINITY_DN1500_c0_g1_i6:92-2434(-)
MTYLSQFYHAYKNGPKAAAGGIASIKVDQADTTPNDVKESEKKKIEENKRRMEDERKQAEEDARKRREMEENRKRIEEENRRRMEENERKMKDWKEQNQQKRSRSDGDAKCAKCGLQLEGDTIELQNTLKEYHKKCFGCTSCGKKIGVRPILVNENPYCEQCGKNALVSTTIDKAAPSDITPMDTTSSASVPASVRSNTAPSGVSAPSGIASGSKRVTSVSGSGQVKTCPRCKVNAHTKYCSQCGGLTSIITSPTSPPPHTPLQQTITHDKAKEDKARQDKAKEDKAKEDKAREDKAREDKAKEDKVREDKAKEDKAREDKAREEKAREDKAREDKVREDKAREDKSRKEKIEKERLERDKVEEERTRERREEESRQGRDKTDQDRSVINQALPKSEKQSNQEQDAHNTTPTSTLTSTSTTPTSTSDPAWMTRLKDRKTQRMTTVFGPASASTSSPSAVSPEKVAPQLPTKPEHQKAAPIQVESQVEPEWVKMAQVRRDTFQAKNKEADVHPTPDSPPSRPPPEIPENPKKSRAQIRATPSIGAITDKAALQLEGWMFKEDSNAMIKSWRKRWFCVREDQLLYWKTQQKKFTNAKDSPPHGSISLRNVTSVEPVLDGGRPNVFKLITSELEYNLQATDEESALRWMAGLIQEVCRIQLEPVLKPESVVATPFAQLHEIKEGPLEKMGHFKKWSTLYTVVKGGVIFFFEKKGGKKKSKFPLYKALLEEYNPESNPACFKITALGKTIILRASDEQEMHHWLNTILRQKIMIEETVNAITHT